MFSSIKRSGSGFPVFLLLTGKLTGGGGWFDWSPQQEREGN
jgi:hypothetical protein